MCYNCGCELPDDDMGKGQLQEGGGALTDKTWEHLARVWKTKPEDMMRNTYEMLKKKLGK